MAKKSENLSVRMSAETKRIAMKRAEELDIDLAPFIRMLIMKYEREQKGSN